MIVFNNILSPNVAAQGQPSAVAVNMRTEPSVTSNIIANSISATSSAKQALNNRHATPNLQNNKAALSAQIIAQNKTASLADIKYMPSFAAKPADPAPSEKLNVMNNKTDRALETIEASQEKTTNTQKAAEKAYISSYILTENNDNEQTNITFSA